MAGTSDVSRPARGPRRGRPPRLTREAIADAALGLGFERLTLTTVADRLGVSHSALYRHVTDREGLVVAMLDRAIERAPWPPETGDWRADLSAQAWTLWRLLEAHPGIEREVAALTGYPARMTERFGRAVDRLTGARFTAADAFLAVDAVFDLTVAQFTQARQVARTRRALTTADPGGDWASAAGPATAPMMRAALHDPPEVWFGRKLDLLLDGIATRATAG
ncbi:TetR family transcriptional regulator [Actinomadura madurae]|uniref:TetR/AcrR family transcriptional regulator n=1 Tax=Actinomadura madurae TaxID=1993 RepID=UPI002025E3F6|nr:TetR family transcriptional regulator [Actinomadura madurae]URM93862.1 TetR family transcriptional regulator [Actinomadura madurae]URN04586.1 TetR family transcriptional regulator [Actinomadura madurae]